MEKQLGHFLLILLSTKEVADQNKSTIILEQKLHFLSGDVTVCDKESLCAFATLFM